MPRNRWCCSGDRDHLRQAIANLVTNAVGHTPPGTPIESRPPPTARARSCRCVTTGRGLDAAALEHAFDRFWQGDRSRVGSGSGLGLAIVDSIAREHGGTVAAANAVDGGAVFTVRLPLEVVQPPPTATPPGTPPPLTSPPVAPAPPTPPTPLASPPVA